MSKWLLIVTTVLTPVTALALPAVGTSRADAQLEDSWERLDAFSNYRGMPVLVLYEDKSSSGQNVELKRELTEIAQDGRYKGIVAFMPIADVSSYDYWPVRAFARRSVQKQSLATHTNIICDWKGVVRDALGLDKKSSNVVLYDKDAKVVFAHAGALSPEQRAVLFAMLRDQVEQQAKK